MSNADTPNDPRADGPSQDSAVSLRHQRYYLETITFKVEDCIFKVPRYHFEHSSDIFAQMFTFPSRTDVPCEGQTDENPVVLGGIHTAEFEALLNVLYPLNYPTLLSNEEGPNWNTKEDWISVLKLATRWNFLAARKSAIDRLRASGDIDDIELILLARQYDIADWLRAGYTNLAQRAERISEEEAQKIGWDTAYRLGHMRELGLQDRHSKQTLTSGVRHAGKFVNVVFEAEMKQAEWASARYLSTPTLWPSPNR
ncbi:hypothetical protein R3P38DRAFT_3308623 [Favolaschia claudopus]|uniref:BTB domain-containing protein n=1 Tax=Favolaschia claudopus TaxID=2862362 RepID=A0AAW0D081_9AGAR